MRNITIVLALLLMAITPIYAQLISSCSAPINIDATNPFSQNQTINMVNGDYWVEFKIDPLTANRYVDLTLTNNTGQTKYEYKVYGPFDNTYNCGSLGTELVSGNSFIFNNPVVSGNCITYDETTNSPAITFEMNSSANTRYYILKITLAPGEFSNQQSISVSSSPTTVIPNINQTTYCPNYTEGTDTPCATNNVCSTPITLCTDFTQTHDCSNCGFLFRYNRFYVLDIQHPNTTVNINIPNFHVGASVTYSLSNQMVYGPCDPNLMLPSNLLSNYTGNQTFSHTFANTGLYLLNLAIYIDACPTIEIDFVDIDANCNPIVTPPTVDFQAICSGNNLSNNVNLVYNGDFEVGNQPENVTMINSDNIYQANNTTFFPSPENYFISPVPRVFSGTVINDHTNPNNGFVMLVWERDQTPGQFAWKKTINNLLPNTSYNFEAWFTSILINISQSGPDNINLYINNSLVATKDRANISSGNWESINYVWNSGTNTTADLRIELTNASNDIIDRGLVFLDDISFSMVESEMECCNNHEIIFDLIASGDTTGAVYTWDFGDGSPTSNTNIHSYTTPGTYTVTLTVSLQGMITTIAHTITIIDCDYLCETCIGSFAPIPGQKYVISAWAKELNAPATKTSYDYPEIRIAFNDGNNTVLGPFTPTGEIIDGWQRIEVEFMIPSTAQDMEILLGSNTGEVLFDDIRVFPFNSNMKSFVYDPVNLRLVAELDERHYATYYEYDESGQLIRVKKETERGIKTIQENRSNTSKNE